GGPTGLASSTRAHVRRPAVQRFHLHSAIVAAAAGHVHPPTLLGDNHGAAELPDSTNRRDHRRTASKRGLVIVYHADADLLRGRVSCGRMALCPTRRVGTISSLPVGRVVRQGTGALGLA